MVTLCHVFGVHRSSYKYWKNRPETPDGGRAILRSQVLELHNISHGSAGTRSIATMATLRDFRMERWFAGRLMKEPGLASCQQPAHRYKRGGHEHIAFPNHLERQFAVTEPNQMWCGDVTCISLGIPCRCSRPVREETSGPGNVVFTGQQTDHQSAGNGVGNSWQTSKSHVPQRSGQSLYKQAVPAVTVAVSDQAKYGSPWKLLGYSF